MEINRIKMEESWKKLLAPEFQQEYMRNLRDFLYAEIKAGKTIYPNCSEIFSALNTTPFNKVKVIIIGQDPYHGPGQAHGMCFSVKPGIRPPPSLKNIFLELKNDLDLTIPSNGCLEHWAKQGVLLLNTVLTVEAGLAASHKGKGWEKFTDAIVKHLNEKCEHLVFLLWGRHAREKGKILNHSRHLILESGHPSPLSVKSFLGNHHFSKTNAYLKKWGLKEIDFGVTSEAHRKI